MTANYMRQNSFTLTPELTLTVVGSDRPHLTNVDDAMRRRFMILEMNYRPAKPDPDLASALLAEADGILSWMIEGAMDWYRNGLVIPAAVLNATEGYFELEDVFSRWIDECCETGPYCAALGNDL